MRSAFIFFSALIVVLWCCGPGAADFYRYVDENGVVVYSDAPPGVDQTPQSNVQVYEAPDVAPALKTPRKPRPVLKPRPPKAVAKPGPTDAELAVYFAGLDKLREKGNSLKKEKDELLKERAELVEKGHGLKRKKAVRKYNRLVKELNQKFKNLEERVMAYEKERKAFRAANEALKKAAARTAATP